MLEKKVLVSLSTDTKRKLDELSSEFGLPPAVVARYAIYRLLDESGRGFIDKPIGLAGPAFRQSFLEDGIRYRQLEGGARLQELIEADDEKIVADAVNWLDDLSNQELLEMARGAGLPIDAIDPSSATASRFAIIKALAMKVLKDFRAKFQAGGPA